MKKIISSIIFLMIVTIMMFSVNSYAILLDRIDVQVDKTTVRPGENVTVNINFGESLGAYTANVSYDNKLFEYVSTEGGTVNDTSDKVKVVYFDQTGGENPRTSMSVTFKAKEGITTSNPTEFTVTLEGMANNNASITFDDITTPIIKNVVVEPEFLEYSLNLQYTGDVLENEAKDMKISYSSKSGRYFTKARLVAEATTPEGATVQLIGIDSESLKHDLIQSGWGDPQGYEIGGKDFAQVLDVQGTFSKKGAYTITLKLIDRENSDSVIAQNTFNITVSEKEEQVQKPGEDVGAVKPDNNKPQEESKINQQTTTENKQPNKLPKTGTNIYIPLGMILFSLVGAVIVNNKK